MDVKNPNSSLNFLEDPFGSVFFGRPKWVFVFFPKYLLKWCKNKDKKERCHLAKTQSPTESVS